MELRIITTKDHRLWTSEKLSRRFIVFVFDVSSHILSSKNSLRDFKRINEESPLY